MAGPSSAGRTRRTIRQRLVWDNIAMGTLLLLAGSIVIWQVNLLADAVSRLQVTWERATAALEVRQASTDLIAAISRLLPVEDAAAFETEVTAALTALQQSHADLAALTAKAAQAEAAYPLLNQVSSSIDSVIGIAETMVRQASAEQWPSVRVSAGVLTRDHRQLASETDELVELAKETEEHETEQVTSARQAAVLYPALVVGLSVALGALLARRTTRSIARPIERLTQGAAQLAAGFLDERVVAEGTHELGQLVAAFNQMAANLKASQAELEHRVKARTEQLQASAEVGRASVSILDPDQLLREVVNLIADRFGFYYAAIFTLDEAGKFAVLREATGEAGRALKARGHKLEVGGQSMVGYVTAQRQLRIALDVGEEPIRFASPLLPETRSEIALPLVVGDRTLGALDVQSTQEAAFDEASAAALQATADQVAVALNNAEQFRRAERQASAQANLLKAALELAGQPNHEALFDLIIHRAMELFHADGASIWLPIGDDEIAPVAAINVARTEMAGQRLRKGEGLSGKVFATGHALRIDNYRAWAGADGPFHTALCVPMTWQGQVTGVLAITVSQPGAVFTADDERAAQLFAAQVASAIERVRLLEQQQRTLNELDAVNRRLTGQAWAEQFQRLPADAQHAQFAQGSFQPIEADWLPEVELAVTAVKPVAWSQRQDQTLSSPFQAAMAAPIVLRGEVIGALQVGEASRPRAWSAEDLAFIQAVADQVALAVENARLIGETQRAAQREKTIADIADKIHRPIDLESILRTAVEEVSRITGAGEVSLRLGVGAPSHASAEGNPHA